MNYYTLFTWCIQAGPGAHPALCTMDTRFLSRMVKRPGRGVDQRYLAPRLKKDSKYTSNSSVVIRSLFWGDI